GKFVSRLGDVRFDQPDPVEYAAASDEQTVATVAKGTLSRWRKGEDKPLWEVKLSDVARKEEGQIGVTGVLVSPDGRRVAVTGREGQVWVFDAKTGKLVARAESRDGAVRSSALSPDGKQLV